MRAIIVIGLVIILLQIIVAMTEQPYTETNILVIREKSKQPRHIVVFVADWCKYCRAFQPILDDLIEQSFETGFIVTVYHDTDVEAVKFYNVKGFPTIFVNGELYAGVRMPEPLISACMES